VIAEKDLEQDAMLKDLQRKGKRNNQLYQLVVTKIPGPISGRSDFSNGA